MRILLSLLMLVVLGPVVAMVYADGWANVGRNGPRLPRDDALVEISPFAGLIHATQRYRAENSCATAEFLSAVVLVDKPEQETLVVSEFVNSIRGECELFSLAEEETEPTFQSIKETGELPAISYIFSLFVYDPDLEGGLAGYAEETVGLFAELGTCDRVERVARGLNLPTRKCAPWTGKELL